MNNYLVLKDNLISNLSDNFSIQSQYKTEKRLNTLISKFIVPLEQKEIYKLLKEKIVNQYEEEKENITFSTLIEKSKKNFVVTLIIFDDDYIYSNLLRKEYYDIELATHYFNHLKQIIQNSCIDSLALYILENM